MTVDPHTGMVEQGYRRVTEDEWARDVVPRLAGLRSVADEGLGLDGWHDDTVGPYPEGLVAFVSRRTGQRYVRE